MTTCVTRAGIGRRHFLCGGATAVAGAAAAALTPAAAAAAPGPALARVSYPVSRLANVRDLKAAEPLVVAYPDPDSPGLLIKVGQAIDGGVGPDGDIVGFSTLCPHKGHALVYAAEDKTLNCPVHYSRFDSEKGGLQVFGHATQNLPQFTLRVDADGEIHAEGVDELIYGRLSNVLG